MNDGQRQTLLVSVLILLLLVFFAAMSGVFLDRVNTSAFEIIAPITLGGIVLLTMASSRPTNSILRFEGARGKFGALKEEVAFQQETINKLVIYSLARNNLSRETCSGK